MPPFFSNPFPSDFNHAPLFTLACIFGASFPLFQRSALNNFHFYVSISIGKLAIAGGEGRGVSVCLRLFCDSPLSYSLVITHFRVIILFQHLDGTYSLSPWQLNYALVDTAVTGRRMYITYTYGDCKDCGQSELHRVRRDRSCTKFDVVSSLSWVQTL